MRAKVKVCCSKSLAIMWPFYSSNSKCFPEKKHSEAFILSIQVSCDYLARLLQRFHLITAQESANQTKSEKMSTAKVNKTDLPSSVPLHPQSSESIVTVTADDGMLRLGRREAWAVLKSANLSGCFNKLCKSCEYFRTFLILDN